MDMQVRIEGLREIDAAMAELPKRVQRALLIRVLNEQAQPLIAEAKALAPVQFGDLQGSITVTERLPKGDKGRYDAGAAAYSAAMSAGASRAEAQAALRSARRASPNAFARVFVGPGRNPQAVFQEFGTVHHAARPYLRPAFDKVGPKILAGMTSRILSEIEKSWARLARRRGAR